MLPMQTLPRRGACSFSIRSVRNPSSHDPEAQPCPNISLSRRRALDDAADFCSARSSSWRFLNRPSICVSHILIPFLRGGSSRRSGGRGGGGGRGFIVVEFPQHLLHVLELLLGLCNRLCQTLEALLVVRLVVCARLILVCAEVLYLLAAVLDLGESERGRRALEEMSELRQLGEVFLFPAFTQGSVS